MPKKSHLNHIEIANLAYDLALSLASKDASIKTPSDLIDKIESLYPECVDAINTHREKVKAKGIFG